MTIKAFLNQAFYLDRLIEANKCELERLRLLAESVPIPDLSQERVQGGEQSDYVSKIVVSIVDLEKEIQVDIDRYIQVKQDIRCVINAIKKPILKLILQERYLNFKKWQEIADDTNYSLQRLFEIHNEALREAEQIKNQSHTEYNYPV